MKELPFPEYIKFDFLLVLIGIGSIIVVIYLVFFKEISLNEEMGIVSLVFTIILMLFGFLMFVVGFHEMAKNYDREARLAEIKFKLQEIKIRLEIKTIQKDLPKQ